MIATVTLDGNPVKAEFFVDPYVALNWLIMKRLVWGTEATYSLESIDGCILHTI